MFSELNEGEWNLRVTKKADTVTVILIATGGSVKTPVRFTGDAAELDQKLPELLGSVMAEHKSLEEQAAAAKAAAKAAAEASKTSAAAKSASTTAKSATPKTTASPSTPAKSETAQAAKGFDIFGEE